VAVWPNEVVDLSEAVICRHRNAGFCAIEVANWVVCCGGGGRKVDLWIRFA
jgi:hypothetical protein